MLQTVILDKITKENTGTKASWQPTLLQIIIISAYETSTSHHPVQHT
jgi:hypothetical protein